jgi:hypothetical protein
VGDEAGQQPCWESSGHYVKGPRLLSVGNKQHQTVNSMPVTGLSSLVWAQGLSSWNSPFWGILTRVQLLLTLHPLLSTCSSPRLL